MTVRQIIVSQDAELLRVWLLGRFGVDVGAKEANVLAGKAFKHAMELFGHGYEDCDTWALWFSNRLRELHKVFYHGNGDGLSGDRLSSCTFHVFFLSLEESPEMLERLRNENKTAQASVASSKISRTPLATIEPIDRVARRVVPQH